MGDELSFNEPQVYYQQGGTRVQEVDIYVGGRRVSLGPKWLESNNLVDADGRLLEGLGKVAATYRETQAIKATKQLGYRIIAHGDDPIREMLGLSSNDQTADVIGVKHKPHNTLNGVEYRFEFRVVDSKGKRIPEYTVNAGGQLDGPRQKILELINPNNTSDTAQKFRQAVLAKEGLPADARINDQGQIKRVKMSVFMAADTDFSKLGAGTDAQGEKVVHTWKDGKVHGKNGPVLAAAADDPGVDLLTRKGKVPATVVHTTPRLGPELRVDQSLEGISKIPVSAAVAESLKTRMAGKSKGLASILVMQLLGYLTAKAMAEQQNKFITDSVEKAGDEVRKALIADLELKRSEFQAAYDPEMCQFVYMNMYFDFRSVRDRDDIDASMVVSTNLGSTFVKAEYSFDPAPEPSTSKEFVFPIGRIETNHIAFSVPVDLRTLVSEPSDEPHCVIE